MTPLTPTEAHVRHFAEKLLAEHGLSLWSVEFDRAVKRAGVCIYSRKVISFSRALIKARPVEDTLDTVRHEVAHALAGHKAGHGPGWKRIFRQLGGTGERCYDSSTIDRDKLEHRYVGSCPNGHKSYFARKLTATRRSCPECNPRRFDDRYLITIIDTRTGTTAEHAKRPVRRNTRRTSSVGTVNGRIVGW